MDIIREGSRLVNKVFNVGNEGLEKLELANIGKLFKSEFASLSESLLAQSDPLRHSNNEFGSRQEGSAGPFSLLAVFVTVLAASLAVNPEVLKYVGGSKGAVCTFKGDGNGAVLGSVSILQKPGASSAIFSLNLSGLAPGKHGFHVHQNGDLSDSCKGAGGHFNPLLENHSGPTSTERHVGDLGNVFANVDGKVIADIVDTKATLEGDLDITGKAIVIHEGEDDLGNGGDAGSLATGNAGGRAGCCIIERV